MTGATSSKVSTVQAREGSHRPEATDAETSETRILNALNSFAVSGDAPSSRAPQLSSWKRPRSRITVAASASASSSPRVPERARRRAARRPRTRSPRVGPRAVPPGARAPPAVRLALCHGAPKHLLLLRELAGRPRLSTSRSTGAGAAACAGAASRPGHVGSAVAEWRVQELQTKRLTRRDTIDTITRRAVGVVTSSSSSRRPRRRAEPLGDVRRRRRPRSAANASAPAAVRVLARDAYHRATHVHVHGVHRGAVVRARAAERATRRQAHQAGAEHLDVFRSGAERLRRVRAISSSTNATDTAPTATENSEATPSSTARRTPRPHFRVALDVEHALKVRPVLFGHFVSTFPDSPARRVRIEPLARPAPAVFRPNQPDIHPGVSAPLLPAGRHVRVPELAAYLRVRERAEPRTRWRVTRSIASSSGTPTASGGGRRFAADGHRLIARTTPVSPARAPRPLSPPRAYAAYASTYARRAHRLDDSVQPQSTAVTFPFCALQSPRRARSAHHSRGACVTDAFGRTCAAKRPARVRSSLAAVLNATRVRRSHARLDDVHRRTRCAGRRRRSVARARRS